MAALDALRAAIPEAARDIRLNLQSVLEGGPLSPAQRWQVAIAAALAARDPQLAEALAEAARTVGVGEPVFDDARAAAALMAMNNVFYRFRHIIGKPSYAERPARLRMNRLVRTAGARVDFELACLAVSAINGCESCVRAHEAAVLAGGLGEDHVHDAVRIAATVNAAAVSLSMNGAAPLEVAPLVAAAE
jgi:alkyl hydroperoxide reductase subunit D